MKKLLKSFLFIIFVLSIQSCSNRTLKNDWDNDNLKGEVKSFKEFSYSAIKRFGEIEKYQRNRDNIFDYDFQNKYNKFGNKVEEIFFDKNNRKTQKYTYQYNENGNKMEFL